jgi:DNA-binding response OmpR family regulator
MKRPCILVMDAEFPGSISTRKLVIETAKFNVITAYSGNEAVETLERFPNIDAAILNAADRDIACAELVVRLKKIVPGLPIIVSSADGDDNCDGAEYSIRSFDPGLMLETLQAMFSKATIEIKEQEKKLTQETERLVDWENPGTPSSDSGADRRTGRAT